MITPMTVTPTVAPIERANWVSAVAEPICSRRTAFCTESTNTCIIEPIPMPAMTMFRAARRMHIHAPQQEHRGGEDERADDGVPAVAARPRDPLSGRERRGHRSEHQRGQHHA